QSIGRLKEWIKTCVTSHSRCSNTGTVLPTRLLDINDLTAVKLIEHHDSNVKHYTALSHCWGSSNTFLTTRANIRSMKAGFNIDGIPKTFRDAILVTRAIGIRYLWIDSLCIIQGDASDWQSEGGKMADVYSSALLTISAANSNGDSQGFLAPRRFEYMRVVVSAGPDLSATAYLHKKSYWNDHNQEPLDARAWTLQEQYLSSRNVRYCGKEMSWRCRTSAWNESAIDNGYFREWERPWTDLVEEFSRRILTYDSDRLTAMAGVASSVAQRNGNIYCAGVWLQNMPDELLFERKDAKSPSEYIAPSWSWAALNGPVVF
ncbi:heterokaryon incompatibility protein-domain-containing protein, partial [Hyaloscypha finlandica]